MRGRSDRPRPLDQFRIAQAEGCTMAEAAARIADREEQARLATAKAAHTAAMGKLRAKGWHSRHRR